ncbi:MAG: PorP/SprF family type IX secretion system membrane protein [Flavobacteriales bacterium]|nr:PorP/SprF family type IX secretion system membrane protein [Flavobacteriales bacterium]
MKNNILKLFLLSFTLVLLGNNAYGQDPAFSQFYSNPLYLNPAFAGANNNGCPTAILNYRDQWPGIGRTYVTYSASYDQHVDALGGGIGILIHKDQAGSGNLNTLNASLIYSYLLEVNRDLTFKVGFETSYKSLDLDWGNLTFGDQIDPTYGFIYTTQEDIVNNPNHVDYPDFSTGFLGYTEKMYFGFSAHHLTQPNQGFISVSNLPTKYTAHIGGKWPLSRYKNDIITISPNFLYQKQQEFQQFNYGVYINRGPIVGGLWARNSLENFDSFILMFGVIQDAFKFGYSYDITVSNLRNSNTLGAHELSFTLYMPCKTRSKSFNTISCPQF